ncbi:YchJ family protein [Streptomyces sp. H39-S7]|uniref:YchJ family protein n=1 Tax=Streptomyces sp. H39-S7 TaxID=3004357 RepID=UPI0022AEDA02|nr:YchJ family metal-binding protein [Streptomyces sp. H39-S7]MCZ4124460.1 YchJ family metal-binding protein [Streptomyces sp. H39-S7]
MTQNSARPSVTARPTAPCPCGLDASYRDCCGRLHRGEAAAPTAERLMRSRFSAFAVRDAAYLLRTWHSTTRPPGIAFEPGQRWTRLEIIGTADGSAFHTEGTVEFRAHYSLRGHTDSQHELSRFVREDALWVYLGEAGG